MFQPEELKKNEPLLWSVGTGTQVWELFSACAAGDLETVERLIGVNPSLIRSHYEYRTPLYFAVRENRMAVARFLVDRGANPFYNGDDLVEIARLRRLADMESCKKCDEGWRSLHEGLLPKEVFELLGKMAPPEIRSDSDSKWDQEGYEFAFAKGKLKSWSKPAPYVFKVNK